MSHKVQASLADSSAGRIVLWCEMLKRAPGRKNTAIQAIARELAEWLLGEL